MCDLKGRTALVTGAASGIGAATAIAFARAGADVALGWLPTDPHDVGSVRDAVKAAGRRAIVSELNVTSTESVDSFVAEAFKTFGRVDIVVANAGIAPMQSGEDGWRDVIDVNLTGVHNTVEAAIPAMVEKGEGGSIVLTSSSAGLAGIGSHDAGAIGYTAAKHGVVGLMRLYANLLAPHSIRVNSVHPSGVDTPMINNEFTRNWLAKMVEETDTTLGNGNALPVEVLQPEDVANAVAWLVSDEARYITGVTLPVDAGYLNKH